MTYLIKIDEFFIPASIGFCLICYKYKENNVSVIFVIIGFALLLIGGESLLRGAIALGRQLQMSPLFIGVVIIGFGTSMPEMAIGVDAVLSDASPIVVGNSVGSNIANILFILACAALIKPIARSGRVLFPDGLLLIIISLGFVLICTQKTIPAWQGAFMLAILVLLLTIEYLRIKRKADLEALLKKAPIPVKNEKTMHPLFALFFIIVGIVALVFGADYLIAGGSDIARTFNVPEEVIGLSIIAIGTSLPELASAVVASSRGHSEVAYGNIFGSNLFNLLGIIGVSSFVGTLEVPPSISMIDGPVMIIATILMLVFLWTGKGLSRKEGLLMLLAYVAYITARFIWS